MIYMKEYGVINAETDPEIRDFLKFVIAKMILNSLESLTLLCSQQICVNHHVLDVMNPTFEKTDQFELAIALCEKHVVEFPDCTTEDILVALTDECRLLKSIHRRAAEIFFLIYDGFIESQKKFNMRQIADILLTCVYSKPMNEDCEDVKLALKWTLNADSAPFIIERIKNRSESKVVKL